MKKIVVLTGAGVSAESGIRTFRDNDGYWRQYHYEEVASPRAWEQHPELVLEFYNERRKNVIESEPNAAHKALADLEKAYNVHIITQNVDDMHERAGSSNVLHLHGEIRKSRSTIDPSLVYDIEGWELKMGDVCEKGSQLRPDIVWFGEPVPMMDDAIELVSDAEIFLIIGTSLLVYPAASLVHYAPDDAVKYLIDPSANPQALVHHLEVIRKKATDGVPELVFKLLSVSED
jgi:NAD-dependent deacetylase